MGGMVVFEGELCDVRGNVIFEEGFVGREIMCYCGYNSSKVI